MKKIITSFLLIILFISFNMYPISSEEAWTNPYSDVTEDDWFFNASCAVGYNDFLPKQNLFNPNKNITRAELAFALYSLADFRGLAKDSAECDFADLEKDSEFFVPAAWCCKNEIMDFVNDNSFSPGENVTKEEFCSILINFVNSLDLALAQKAEPQQFIDSLLISPENRSAVMACKIAKIVNGYGNGYFYPQNPVLRSELASCLYSLMTAVVQSSDSEKQANTSAGAYDSLYNSFLPIPEEGFSPFVAETTAVPDSFFDNAVFIGDSISVKLQFFNKETAALGGAKFLCAESLSSMSAVSDVTDESIHPSFRGKKVKPSDGVLMTGAQKVYIMLGMNGIGIDFDLSLHTTEALIRDILAKSPEAIIFVQSVTPITYASSRADDTLNINSINNYNAQLSKMCSDNAWYYLDVASALKDEYGYLNPDFCSDDTGMGIHFNDKGADVWANYLKTHIPPGLN